MINKNILILGLLGATAVAVYAYSRGGPKEEALAYASVEECVKAGQQDEAVCKSEFAKAQKLHEEVAPRYNSARDCNSDFGYNRCYRSRSALGGSIWLPFMVGYLLAPRGGRFISTQPLYRPSSNPNQFYTAGNGRVGAVSADGRARVSKSQAKRPSARTRTVARGGFGARATRGRGAGG
jgi:uncharacterized protein YgiB involved in biofilm formation